VLKLEVLPAANMPVRHMTITDKVPQTTIMSWDIGLVLGIGGNGGKKQTRPGLFWGTFLTKLSYNL
jgi:hypothetical protein